MEIKQGIYMILNLINNKYYIGSSVNIYNRWKGHRFCLNHNKHSSKHLQYAWNKYGKENFQLVILEKVIEASDLLEREQWWIDNSLCCDPKYGYNTCKIAGNCLGVKHSEEFRKKMSEITKGKGIGRKATDEARKNLSISHKGIRMSEETKKKISEANKGKRHSPETIQKMKNAQKGKTISLEHRKAISKANKGKKASEETLKKLSLFQKSRVRTKDTYNKISASLSKTYCGFITPDGEKVIITNMKQFCKDNNLNNANMYALISGTRKQHKGWTYQKGLNLEEVI